jgi:hypothetical protein
MRNIDITPLSSSADAGELQAAIMAAQPGSAFSLQLGDGRAAILTCSALRSGAAPADPACPPALALALNGEATGISKLESKRLAREEDFAEITNRLLSGKAHSVHAAALQVTRGNFNRAHYRGKQYRKTHCLPASAFSKKITDFPMT